MQSCIHILLNLILQRDVAGEFKGKKYEDIVSATFKKKYTATRIIDEVSYQIIVVNERDSWEATQTVKRYVDDWNSV